MCVLDDQDSCYGIWHDHLSNTATSDISCVPLFCARSSFIYSLYHICSPSLRGQVV